MNLKKFLSQITFVREKIPSIVKKKILMKIVRDHQDRITSQLRFKKVDNSPMLLITSRLSVVFNRQPLSSNNHQYN